LGQATEVTLGASVQRGRFQVTTDRGGQNQSETKRPLLTPDEVQNIGKDELLAKMPNLSPVRLMQRRYFEDDEVKDRAPARGQYWVPPLGQDRQDGALEPPPPLILPPLAPVEAQAAQPEHEHASAAAVDVNGTGNTTGEKPAVDDGWYGGLPTGDGPDVDR